MARHKSLAWLSRWLRHPALSRLSRRTVAGGVGAGLLCGLIPGPFQMLGAALLSIGMRWNAAVAMAVTLYTNPLTIIPLYLLAYRFGLALLRPGMPVDMAAVVPPDFEFAHPGDSMAALGGWVLSLGWPLVLGLVALGLVLAVAGYTIVWFGWGWTLVWARRRRRLARARRARGAAKPKATSKVEPGVKPGVKP